MPLVLADLLSDRFQPKSDMSRASPLPRLVSTRGVEFCVRKPSSEPLPALSGADEIEREVIARNVRTVTHSGVAVALRLVFGVMP